LLQNFALVECDPAKGSFTPVVFVGDNFKRDLPYECASGRSSSCRDSFVGFVLAQQESAEDHPHRHPAQQAIDIYVSHRRSLSIELTINLSARHRGRPLAAGHTRIRVGERIEPLRKDWISNLCRFSLLNRLTKTQVIDFITLIPSNN
jgi:hypothetical protein